jgi:hypothetical protein
MIVFTATLLNANGRDFDKSLGVFTIINDGTGARMSGNYDVQLKLSRGRALRGRVENFPRRSRGTWELLRRALNDLHGQGKL